MEDKKQQSKKSKKALSGVKVEQVFMGLNEKQKEDDAETERNQETRRPLKKKKKKKVT